MSKTFVLRVESLDPRIVPAADSSLTFTLDNSVEVEAQFSIPLENVDSDIGDQRIALDDWSLDVGGNDVASNDDFTPVAVFLEGVFQGIEFTVENNDSLTENGFDSLMVDLTSAKAVSGGVEQYATAEPLMATKPAITIDFSPISRNLDQTISVKVTTADGGTKTVAVFVPAGSTKGAIRDLIKSALEDEGFDVSGGGDTRITIKSKCNGSNITSIDVTSTDPNFIPPKNGGHVPGPNGEFPTLNPGR